jgi:hypothetical protein
LLEYSNFQSPGAFVCQFPLEAIPKFIVEFSMYDCTEFREMSLSCDQNDSRMMKARQSAKIREIADALASAGFVGLDAQAQILGICRSTAWTILQGSHKSSGISPTLISRMLKADALPTSVRAKIVEYASEKAAGSYGHNALQRRRFIGALSEKAGMRFSLRNAARTRSRADIDDLRLVEHSPG